MTPYIPIFKEFEQYLRLNFSSPNKHIAYKTEK